MSAREREDVSEAMKRISSSLDSRKVRRKEFAFQIYVSVLLMLLVIITTTSFGYAMRSEREARLRSEARQVVFEAHVRDILDSIEETQHEGHEERQHISGTVDAIRELIEDHVNMVNRSWQ
jgi:hypothetical protein